MDLNNQIIIYQTEDGQTQVDVRMENDMIWLTRQQIAVLFGRDYKTISKHINNALKEELAGSVVVAKFANTTQHGAIEGKTQTHEIDYFNLEVITSVGYRVKSKRGVQFRQWANNVLKQYLIKGYAVNERMRKEQIGELRQLVGMLGRTIQSQRKVCYEGEETSISALSAKLKGYKVKHIQPTPHWLFNDRLLSEIYDETYPFEE